MNTYFTKEEMALRKVQEPAIAYASPNMRDTYLTIVSEDLFQEAIAKAESDFLAGKVTPHEQMDDWVRTRMGWK